MEVSLLSKCCTADTPYSCVLFYIMDCLLVVFVSASCLCAAAWLCFAVWLRASMKHHEQIEAGEEDTIIQMVISVS